MSHSVITVIGKDRVGIVYDVSKLLAENQMNILNISQQLMDDFFTMIILVDTAKCPKSREEMLALFAAESPQRIEDIRAALLAFDSDALSRAAHAVKGAASNVGAHALSEACSALERSCLQGQWPTDAAAQVARICALRDKTCQALREWMQSNGTDKG